MDQVESILARPLIAGVALTGSTRAGAAVAQLAGKHIKRSVLELGGSDPFIVLADANMTRQWKRQCSPDSAMQDSPCIAAKRWIVVEKSMNRSGKKLFRRSEASVRVILYRMIFRWVRWPDQTSLISSWSNTTDLCRKVQKCWCPIRNACHVSPGLLGDVTPEMTAFREELFGPCGC